MRLNLGCGEYYQPMWVNIDWRSPFLCDIVLDLREDLPFPEASVTHVYAGHVLEHLTIDEGTSLLKRLIPLVVPGGELMVVGPDVHRAEAMHERGEMEADFLGLVHGGGHRWHGDEHHWDCEPETLIKMITEAGWGRVAEVPIEDVDPFWPVAGRPLWQCAVGARRPWGFPTAAGNQ